MIDDLAYKYGKIEADQLIRLSRGENIASSDRVSDRARTKLKKHGLITFDRAAWKWVLTQSGERAIRAREAMTERKSITRDSQGQPQTIVGAVVDRLRSNSQS